MKTEPLFAPAISLADEPGAACIVTGPVTLSGAPRYIVRVVNGDKTLSCALTKEQMAEMWFFVRREWKSTEEEIKAFGEAFARVHS